jgi:hypothetical protein
MDMGAEGAARQIPADNGADGTWMSYGDLAASRGIDRTSALKLALRHKWRKQRDNHGVVRVYVPAEWASRQDKGAPPGAAAAVDVSAAIAALEAAIVALRERSEAAERRANAAEAGRDGERARADAIRDTIATMQVELQQARVQAQVAEDWAEAARRMDDARRARGRLARLRAAWRGE